MNKKIKLDNKQTQFLLWVSSLPEVINQDGIFDGHYNLIGRSELLEIIKEGEYNDSGKPILNRVREMYKNGFRKKLQKK